jgi:hypothetical protein
MMKMVRSEVPLHVDCNISREQADVLVRKYLDTPVSQYFSGEVPIRDGQIYRNLIERDELTTNEKMFLVAMAAKAICITNIRNAYQMDHALFAEMIQLNTNAPSGNNNGDMHVDKR